MRWAPASARCQPLGANKADRCIGKVEYKKKRKLLSQYAARLCGRLCAYTNRFVISELDGTAGASFSCSSRRRRHTTIWRPRKVREGVRWWNDGPAIFWVIRVLDITVPYYWSCHCFDSLWRSQKWCEALSLGFVKILIRVRRIHNSSPKNGRWAATLLIIGLVSFRDRSGCRKLSPIFLPFQK